MLHVVAIFLLSLLFFGSTQVVESQVQPYQTSPTDLRLIFLVSQSQNMDSPKVDEARLRFQSVIETIDYVSSFYYNFLDPNANTLPSEISIAVIYFDDTAEAIPLYSDNNSAEYWLELNDYRGDLQNLRDTLDSWETQLLSSACLSGQMVTNCQGNSNIDGAVDKALDLLRAAGRSHNREVGLFLISDGLPCGVGTLPACVDGILNPTITSIQRLPSRWSADEVGFDFEPEDFGEIHPYMLGLGHWENGPGYPVYHDLRNHWEVAIEHSVQIRDVGFQLTPTLVGAFTDFFTKYSSLPPNVSIYTGERNGYSFPGEQRAIDIPILQRTLRIAAGFVPDESGWVNTRINNSDMDMVLTPPISGDSSFIWNLELPPNGVMQLTNRTPQNPPDLLPFPENNRNEVSNENIRRNMFSNDVVYVAMREIPHMVCLYVSNIGCFDHPPPRTALYAYERIPVQVSFAAPFRNEHFDTTAVQIRVDVCTVQPMTNFCDFVGSYPLTSDGIGIYSGNVYPRAGIQRLEVKLRSVETAEERTLVNPAEFNVTDVVFEGITCSVVTPTNQTNQPPQNLNRPGYNWQVGIRAYPDTAGVIPNRPFPLYDYLVGSGTIDMQYGEGNQTEDAYERLIALTNVTAQNLTVREISIRENFQLLAIPSSLPNETLFIFPSNQPIQPALRYVVTAELRLPDAAGTLLTLTHPSCILPVDNIILDRPEPNINMSLSAGQTTIDILVPIQNDIDWLRTESILLSYRVRGYNDLNWGPELSAYLNSNDRYSIPIHNLAIGSYELQIRIRTDAPFPLYPYYWDIMNSDVGFLDGSGQGWIFLTLVNIQQ